MLKFSIFQRVNEAMDIPPKFKQQKKLNLGILDIYGNSEKYQISRYRT